MVRARRALFRLGPWQGVQNQCQAVPPPPLYYILYIVVWGVTEYNTGHRATLG